jgi:hypothetical protein
VKLRRRPITASPEKRAKWKIEKELEQLSKTIVLELRDKWTCQRCGRTRDQVQIQWSHVVTRAAKSIKFATWNLLALCGGNGCHKWVDSHKTEAMAWWREKWPDRSIRLQAWMHERRRPPVSYDLIRFDLNDQIKNWRGEK